MAAPKTKIFVGQLPDGCRSEDLHGLFAQYGTVTECDVISKYGFVHMGTSEEADNAIKHLNNYMLNGSKISVERSNSKLHKEPGTPGRATKKNLPRGGGPMRNGFGPPARRFGGPPPYSNGYRGSPYAPPDPYYDRPYPYARERMYPYPYPYERRDDYARPAMPPPPPPGPEGYYGRPMPMRGAHDDLYNHYPERPDYLYTRRTPPPPSAIEPRPIPSLAGSRRPYY